MFEDMAADDIFWLGYCVGLYEGEGTASVQVMNVRNPDRKYVRLVIRMTDPEPVTVAHRVWGGRLGGPSLSPYEAKRGYKPKYRWTLASVNEALAVIAFMKPFLSARRQAQLQVALDAVTPRIRQGKVAGERRDGLLGPLRSKNSGQLVCPEVPEPSARGYQRHKRLGIPVCDVCRESFRLYYAAKRGWSQDRITATNREQYAKNREARIAAQRAYNLAHRDEINTRQRTYYARKRAERQAQTSVGSASPPSEMAPT
jgi:hypothetical protein